MKHNHSAVMVAARCGCSILLGLLMFGFAASGVKAQSGRKLPDWSKKQPEAAPTPDGKTGAGQDNPQPAKQLIPLVVTTFLAEINSSSILRNVVADSCLSRLGQASAFAIAREGEMNRKQASDKAKGMAGGYVVWMELDVDTADTDRASMGPVDPGLLYVWFIVYESATGKVKTQGHVYQRPANGVLVPGTQANIDYRLQQMGRETADRIMQAIGVQPPAGH